ncbi:hypothetical protein DXV76_15110 [Rhodobacteraceae bacterium CCMM004]|nr:hypothetical protein DXV76_15110 [Rhodobacteraceae bacterium CCMM004]
MSQLETIFVDSAMPVPPAPAAAHPGEHPQLDVPFTAYLDSYSLNGKSISLTHAVVEGTLAPEMDQTAASLGVRIDFNGFALVLFIDVWVEQTGERTYSLRFTDPTGEHLASLRYLLNSYIAGDVVSLGGMMSYSGPLTVKAKAEATAPTLASKAKNALRRTLVVLLSVAMVLTAAHLVHERVIFAYEARPVTLTLPGTTLRATAAGQLSYVDTRADEGEVLYSVLANTGDFYSVKMPCDCGVQPMRDFVLGATVMPGTPLVRLSVGDGALVASAEISAEGAVKLLAGDRVELVTTDGAVIPVRPAVLPQQEPGARSVAIEMTLPEDAAVAAGDVARLRFRRDIVPAPVRRIGRWLGLSAPAAGV